MRLHSYVVARDYGFAPNPFFGTCTLATCKPLIRRHASIGDWVVGTGSSGHGKAGHLVYAMKVEEEMTFNAYWNDPRFQQKRPHFQGSMKQAFGDNIYFRNGDGSWTQQDSHHSFSDGTPNPVNVAHDTQTDRVLISTDFLYWGVNAPQIPLRFRDFNGIDVCAGRGHKNRFPTALVSEFVTWIRTFGETGFLGRPMDW